MTVDLFAPCRIGNIEVRNRFVRSATWDASADASGASTDVSVGIIRDLAHGGVGLIVTGYAYVSPLGHAAPGQYGIHTDEMIPGLRRMVQAAHKGGAKVAVQIVHAGITSHYLPANRIEMLAVSTRADVIASHHEMTDEEVEGVIADFVAAAVRGRKAGFDAVQLHGAHGYLMSQFLSPLFNRRTDRWGGSPENRRRFHLEVARRVRQAIGRDYPLLIKLGMQDADAAGLSLADGIETAKQLVDEGIDAVEVSGGLGGSIRAARADEPERPYFREQSAALKKAVSAPVIEVGGIRSLEMAQSIVDSGDADLISMSRPFIREPGLVNRWQAGQKGPATCISCSQCFGILARGERLECAQERRLREETTADS